MLSAKLGVDLPAALGQPSACPGDVCWQWGDEAQVSITKSADGICYDVAWQARTLERLMDCIDIGTDQVYCFLNWTHNPILCLFTYQSTVWFGGPEEKVQHFPMQPSNTRPEVMKPSNLRN